MRDDYFLEVPEDIKPIKIETKLTELKTHFQSVCEKYKATQFFENTGIPEMENNHG